MKKYLMFIILAAMILVTGCSQTIDGPTPIGDNLLLSYPACNVYNNANSGLNYWSKALLELDLSLPADTVRFSLNLPRALGKAVKAKIGVDEMAYNLHKNSEDKYFSTKYALMPSEYYKIPEQTVEIPAGETSVKATVVFFNEKFDISKTGYLLPISILEADGAPVHEEIKTVFFHVEKDPYPPFSRAKWKAYGCSSEAPEEGGGNGLVNCLFDNNKGTFWHSKWLGGAPPPPHWFSIDMNEDIVITGVILLPRQGVGSNGRPKDIVFEVSNDGSKWTLVQNLVMKDSSEEQKIFLEKPTAPVRYIKMTITSMHGDAANHVYTNLAELKFF